MLQSLSSQKLQLVFVICMVAMVYSLFGVGWGRMLNETTNHSKIQCYLVKMLLKTIIYIPYIYPVSQLISQASIYLVFPRYQRCISNSQSKKIYDWIYHCLRLNSPAVWVTTTEKLHSARAFLSGGICNTQGRARPHQKGQDYLLCSVYRSLKQLNHPHNTLGGFPAP